MTWFQRLLAALLAPAMIDELDVRGAVAVLVSRGVVRQAHGLYLRSTRPRALYSEPAGPGDLERGCGRFSCTCT